jgi:hypothetical protein
MRLVDADALQRAFDDAHKDEPDFFCSNFLNDAGNPSTEWDCVDDILENAPTIDAQPVKHGHWVELPKSLNPNENPCQCSNCKHVVSFYYGYPKSKFCDECGARMSDHFANASKMVEEANEDEQA